MKFVKKFAFSAALEYRQAIFLYQKQEKIQDENNKCYTVISHDNDEE